MSMKHITQKEAEVFLQLSTLQIRAGKLLREYVEVESDGEEGYFVPKNRVDSLQEAFDEFVKNRKLYLAMKEDASNLESSEDSPNPINVFDSMIASEEIPVSGETLVTDSIGPEQSSWSELDRLAYEKWSNSPLPEDTENLQTRLDDRAQVAYFDALSFLRAQTAFRGVRPEDDVIVEFVKEGETNEGANVQEQSVAAPTVSEVQSAQPFLPQRPQQ